ncbi:helix-turn-helix domain-containing protein [Xaviernesmea oryzae]
MPNAVDALVGSRVRMRRVILGLSQQTLAEALGVTFQQLQKYEKGANRIGASRLQRLAQVLDVPVGFFFEGSVDSGEALAVSATADPITQFIGSREGIALITAFASIEDRQVRQTILNLVRSLSSNAKAAEEDEDDVQHLAVSP